jgi:hypothetical protein
MSSSVLEIQSFLGKLEVTPDYPPATAGDLENGPAVPVQHGLLDKRIGVVRGHWQQTVGVGRPDRVYLLPDGASIDVPPGRAVLALADISRTGEECWCLLELAAGGKMIGPLVWGWEEATPSVEFMRQHCQEEYVQAADQRAVLVGLGLLPFFGAFTYLAGTAIHLLAGLGVAFVGLVVTLVAAMITHAEVQSRLRRDESRQPQDVADARVRRQCFELPEELAPAFDEIAARAAAQPKPEFGADGLNFEAREALSRYRHAVRLVERRNGLSGGDMKMIRHSATMIDEIAARFAGSQNLKGDAGMLETFQVLIKRAEADVEQALIRDRIEESQEVRGEMEALMRQMEMRSSI